VKEVLKLIRATLPATITIHDRIDTLACVLADPSQLHQIIMNLCTNAGLAMRERGGTLELILSAREITSGSAIEDLESKPGHYVCLTVKDTGCGIRPEHVGRIFEPFFTTRPKGEGTGLGLSVVHGIVKSSGGAITVASEVGRGTTFEILLPVCEANANVEPEGTLPGQGDERVLFVDDELALTEIARQGLARFGYRVSAFNDPIEALAAFRASPSEFDVLVTDMTMPGLTGDVLATEVRRIRPDMAVILVSGHSDRLTAEQAQAAGFDGFVDKPLRPTTLIQIIRKVCDRRP
jgi:CheY-like chemotaxis protein